MQRKVSKSIFEIQPGSSVWSNWLNQWSGNFSGLGWGCNRIELKKRHCLIGTSWIIWLNQWINEPEQFPLNCSFPDYQKNLASWFQLKKAGPTHLIHTLQVLTTVPIFFNLSLYFILDCKVIPNSCKIYFCIISPLKNYNLALNCLQNPKFLTIRIPIHLTIVRIKQWLHPICS